MEKEPEGIYPKYVVFNHPYFAPTSIEARAYEYKSRHIAELLEQVKDFCFVLKPGTDHHARVAIAAYAYSVMEEKPQLSEELLEILSDGP